MGKSKFIERQIVAALTEVEGGRQVKDVCRDLSILEATYYAWKSKCGGMEASDVHRLRDFVVGGAGVAGGGQITGNSGGLSMSKGIVGVGGSPEGGTGGVGGLQCTTQYWCTK